MDQGPNSRFDLALGRLDRMHFICRLKVTGDLVEARVAGDGYHVVFAGDPKAPIGVGAWCRAKYEKILQLAAIFVLASRRQRFALKKALQLLSESFLNVFSKDQIRRGVFDLDQTAKSIRLVYL